LNRLKVYIAFHRKGKIISDDKMYTPLQVGKEISNVDLDMQNDASGKNISLKNGVYSELTGWYWIWKNKQHKFVGTGHYRRYFTLQQSFLRKTGKLFLFLIGLKNKRYGLYYVSSNSKWKNRILTTEQVEKLMQKYDVILPVKKKFAYSVYTQYKKRHNEKDIILTRKIVEEKYPEYIKSFDETFNSQEMYAFNMFIMPWEIFDRYMNWLFSILFELEKRTEIDWNDQYQKRVCAFMAERLQTVWFNKNQLNIKELTILYFKKMKNPVI